jgi:putative transposase
MDERLQFVADVRRAHESMTALCDRYGLSRKTGYQVWARHQAEGVAGLLEHSRRPDRDQHGDLARTRRRTAPHL